MCIHTRIPNVYRIEYMNYQEFLSVVKEQLAARIEKDARLQVKTLPRNNGTSYDGLMILRPGRNISPTIYLTPYYHRYLDGVALEDIFTDILATYQCHLPEQDFDTSLFTDFEKVHSRIIMRLVSYERNQTLLRDVPFFCFQDLAVVFYCLLMADEKNQASILIHNEHLDMWGIDKDTLYHLARQNTPLLLPHCVTPMKDILLHSPFPDMEDLTECDIPMYVVSNCFRTNGATVLLYERLLQDIADQLASNLIILPSSIHEIIILPTMDHSDLPFYSHMVREVNETQLADEEILSDHAYYYDRITKVISR